MALSLHVPRYPYRLGPRPFPRDFNPFNSIRSFLSDELSLEQTVDQLTAPIERSYDHDGNSTSRILLQSTWQAFNTVVEQIPHHRPEHARLSTLLVAIKSRESPYDGDARVISHAGMLWRDLPLYEPASHGDFSTPTAEIEALTVRAVDIEGDTLSQLGGMHGLAEQYMNQNAFLARLVQLPDAPDCDFFTLLALRWGLEEDLNALGLSLNVPGAAMWILYAGEYIWQCEREWREPYDDIRAVYMANGSFLWGKGRKNGFCVERWEVWRDSFEWVAEMEGVSDEARVLAKAAAGRMRCIESNVRRR